MLLSLLLACTPTFDQTRKDLEDFRLLGMADGPRAAIWSGEGAYHSTAPRLDWTEWKFGTTADRELSVVVESADGHVEQGLLVVQADATPPVVTGFIRTIEGDAATLELTVEGDAITRWMATSGTFTETGPHATQWVADDEPLATIFALTLDGRGGNTWTWIDVSTDATPYLAVGGRLLPYDGDLVSGDVLATLTPADTGVVLTDLAPADADGDVVCGLDPFDADALVDGRCGLDEAGGARVRLTAAAWP